MYSDDSHICEMFDQGLIDETGNISEEIYIGDVDFSEVFSESQWDVGVNSGPAYTWFEQLGTDEYGTSPGTWLIDPVFDDEPKPKTKKCVTSPPALISGQQAWVAVRFKGKPVRIKALILNQNSEGFTVRSNRTDLEYKVPANLVFAQKPDASVLSQVQ